MSMNLSSFRNIYFLGIGGIGMSALARYFRVSGMAVAGYDRTSTPLTAELEAEGMRIHYTDDVSLIPSEFLSGKDAVNETLVVLTPAVPSDHSELRYFRSNGFTVMKRSEVLGLITKDKFTVAVAGTHGKTTTSSMIAHLLKANGMNVAAFLGGITRNYNSNFILAQPDQGKEIVVVEADEYDRSFLALHPDISVITSMDADHLDIYGSAAFMEESYRLFARQLKPGGKLLFREGLTLDRSEGTTATYSLHGNGMYRAENVRISDHRFHFDWIGSGSSITDLFSDMPGLHNVENGVAAVTVASWLGLSPEGIRDAFASYRGVKRRFEYHLRRDDIVYIDDYAHHPEELRACIASVRELYPGKRITGIFQPHLFSRTRDFADGFAKSLSMLDRLILLDIYPARELPMEGVTSGIIFDKVTIADKVMVRKSEALEALASADQDVVLTLGAGDIDQLVGPVCAYLENKNAHV